jgi:hypothetical protein
MRDRIYRIDENLLQRTAEPYMRVNSSRLLRQAPPLRSAITGRELSQQSSLPYSITSSARTSSDVGNSKLRVLAALRLMISSQRQPDELLT